MRHDTRQTVSLSLLVGLSVLLSRFASIRPVFAGVEIVRIGFGALPLVLAGIMYGPWAGAAVGAASDILGFLLSPLGGPYLPHFTLTAALTGFLAGVMSQAIKFKGIYRSLLICAAALIPTKGVLIPLFQAWLFGLPLVATLMVALLNAVILTVVYAICLGAIEGALKAIDSRMS